MTSNEAPVKSIFIGSSNVYRFVKLLDKQLQEIVVMKKCTTMEVFKVEMEEIRKEDKRVIISVIENFLADAVKGLKEPNEITNKVMEIFTEFFDVLKATAEKNPETRFAMVGPMDRPAQKWYATDLDEIEKEFNKRIAAVNRSNVSKINSMLRSSQKFEADEVHLTIEVGKNFVKNILYYAGEFFDATLVEFDEETEMEIATPPSTVEQRDESGPIASGSNMPARDETIQEQIDGIKEDTQRRRHFDSLVTSRLREENDHAINVKKENKIIVTGLESRTPIPNDKVESKKWIDELIGAALNYLIKDASREVAFTTPGRRIERGVPTMFEVRMKDRDMAIKIRKAFSQAMKDKAQMQADGYGKMFVANSVTLATRVRTDVLKAIAQKMTNENEDFFVVGFSSRPVLTVRRKDSSSQYALTYADAVSKFGARISRGDLQVAYGRAGDSFAGLLQQIFVVLHDKKEGAGKVGAGSVNGVAGPAVGAGGKKRGLDDGVTTSAKRQDWRRGNGGRGGARGGPGRGKPAST